MNNFKPTPPPFRKFKKKTFNLAGKVGSFIYQIGESEILRKSSKAVPLGKINSAEYKAKFKYLKKCMLKYRKITGMGRGITAVQIGISERFSVVYTPKNLLIIINPKITKKSSKKYLYPEMCMSANPIIAPTIRPSWIEFEYFNEQGKRKKWTTKDNTKLGKILNRVFQHEIDHMEGIINIDRCSSKDLILESDPKYYKTASFIEV